MTRTKKSRLRRLLLASFAVLAVALTPLVGVQTAAQAAPVVGFNAGNIISDSLFYNGTAMGASEVQAFLNQQVPRCTIGDVSYKMPGSTEQTINPVAANCLKDIRITTQTKPANAYCGTYVGAANETAAQIIAKVGQACGISQKVLLVMLEKEQSLVSDSWPTVRMFNYAMGWGCPDSGPGNTANCDSSGAGFAYQVYQSAWQFKVYKAHPESPSFVRYRPFQSATIQWHPEATCGTSQVYIQNSATSALYIYTPYRPNQAALNAGWGTGDGCSSYGNRNFYNFYKSWFGATQGTVYTVHAAISTYWESAKSWLGDPTSAAVIVPANGGGLLQNFQGGFVYRGNGGLAAGLTRTSPILAAFANSGGIEGPWGWPLEPAKYLGTSGNNSMAFQGGLVVEARDVGVQIINPDLVSYWQSTGGLSGSQGAPISSASTDGSSVVQKFQRNAAVKVEGNGPVLFDLRFIDAWVAAGGMKHQLGLPSGPATTVAANGGGLKYVLNSGTIFDSAFGTVALPEGSILTAYESAGGPSSSWGWPRGRQVCSVDASICSADFGNGVATWSVLRGALFTPLTSSSPATPVRPGAGETVEGGIA